MPDSCPVDELRALLRVRGDRLLEIFRTSTSDALVASAIDAASSSTVASRDAGFSIQVTFNGVDSFCIGQPDWTLTATLRQGSNWCAAIAYQPFTAEWFIATPGSAVHVCRGRKTPLVARRRDPLAPFVVGIGDGAMRATAAEREALRALKAQSAVSRPLSAAYGMCLLAMGQLDVMVETALKADELHALEYIVTTAGGVLTDWRGNEVGAGHVLAAGCRESYDRARDLLAWGSIASPRVDRMSGLSH